MEISIDCPGCGKTLKVPESYIGKMGACPYCKRSMKLVQQETGEQVAKSEAKARPVPKAPTAPNTPPSQKEDKRVDASVQTIKRIVCPHCSKPIELDPSVLEALLAEQQGGTRTAPDSPATQVEGKSGILPLTRRWEQRPVNLIVDRLHGILSRVWRWRCAQRPLHLRPLELVGTLMLPCVLGAVGYYLGQYAPLSGELARIAEPFSRVRNEVAAGYAVVGGVIGLILAVIIMLKSKSK